MYQKWPKVDQGAWRLNAASFLDRRLGQKRGISGQMWDLNKVWSLVNGALCCAVLSRLVVSNCLWLHGLQPARLLCPWGFSRHEYWSGLPCTSPGNLPNPEIEPRSPTLQADSLLSEPPEKPKNAGVGSLSLLQGIFPIQESNWGLLHWRWIIYQLSCPADYWELPTVGMPQ